MLSSMCVDTLNSVNRSLYFKKFIFAFKSRVFFTSLGFREHSDLVTRVPRILRVSRLVTRVPQILKSFRFSHKSSTDINER